MMEYKKPTSQYAETQKHYNWRHSNGMIDEEDPPHTSSVLFSEDLMRFVEEYQFDCDTLLDVGCRTGHMIHELEKNHDVSCVGVDLIPEFVDIASKKGIDVEQGDIHQLRWADDSFDWVFCCQTLEHAHDPQKGIAELCRVAREGVFISIPFEGMESFMRNGSHYVREENMMGWFSLIPDGWDVMWSEKVDYWRDDSRGGYYGNFIISRRKAVNVFGGAAGG